jgi:parallel beta-helix repeat protein
MAKLLKVMAVAALVVVCAVTLSQAETANITAGKQALLTDKDVLTAHGYFDAAVSADPGDQEARLWHAVTILCGNSELMAKLRETGVLNSSNIFAVLDAENNPEAYNPYNVDTIIMDETSASFSGAWTEGDDSSGRDPYGSTYRYCAYGDGSKTATWSPAITVPGYYAVRIWLTGVSTPAGNAKYKINYNGGANSSTITLNQNSSGWRPLGGSYYFTAGAGNSLVLDNSASSGYVTADAVKFEYKGNYTDDSTSGMFQTSGGGWTSKAGGNFNNIHWEHAAGEGATATWTLDVPVANVKYLVWAATNGGMTGLAQNATFTVSPANGTPVDVSVNNYYKTGYHCLGAFTFTQVSGNTVTLHSSASGIVTADCVRIAPERPIPNLTEGQTIAGGTDGNSGMLNQLNAMTGALKDLSYITETFQGKLNSTHFSEIIYEITLDYGEAKALETALYVAVANIKIDSVYNMDNAGLEKIIYNEYSADPSVLLMEYDDLLHLRGAGEVDGAQLLSDAKDAVLSAIDSYSAASSFIRSRSDSDGLNHMLAFYSPYDPDGWDSEEDWLAYKNDNLSKEAFVRDGLTALRNNLTSPVDNPYVTIPAVLSGLGMDGGPGMDIDINFYAFFQSPKDARALLNQLPMSDLIKDGGMPDPTFGGILPNFGDDDWNFIFEYGPVIEHHPIVQWDGDTVSSITVKWDTSYDDNRDSIVRYEIYRSTSAGMLKGEAGTTLVGTVTDKDTLSYADTTVDGASNDYYYMLYTYYDFGADGTATTHSEAVGTRLRVYVNTASASETEDGTKENPVKDLSDAIRNYTGGGTKVCVAAGTYDYFSSNLGVSNSRPGLVLEGGYSGSTWERDLSGNETIIDKSIYPNAVGLGVWGAANVTIDGFTIKNVVDTPNGWMPGIQLLCANGATIRNCRIINCSQGIYVDSTTSCVIDNCYIEGRGNVSTAGEGISIYSWQGPVSVEIKNCVLKNNRLRGIYVNSVNDKAISVTAKNNLVVSNFQQGVYLGRNGTGVITAVFSNNTIAGNTYGISYGNVASMTIRDSIISNNTAYGVHCWAGTAGTITYNDVYGNSSGGYSGCSAGTGSKAVDPLFVDRPNGDYHLQSSSPCIDAGSDTAANLGLDGATTQSDGTKDSGTVDMGYHYLLASEDEIPLNDVIVDFGSEYGIWIKYDDATWTQLHDLSPEAIVACDLDGNSKDDIICDFGTYGIWIYHDTGTWTQLHEVSPDSITAADLDGNGKSDLVIDFGTYGIWIYQDTGTWTQLHSLSPESIIAADLDGNGKSDLVVDFGEFGIWIYHDTGTWTQLHSLSPDSITAADLDGDSKSDLVVDFGTYGIWIYYDTGTWAQLHSLSPKSITAADLDGDGKSDLVVDFDTYGIWIYNDTGTWTQLHSQSPDSITAGDLNSNGKDDLIVDFGTYGLWAYSDGSSWAQFHALSADTVTAAALN